MADQRKPIDHQYSSLQVPDSRRPTIIQHTALSPLSSHGSPVQELEKDFGRSGRTPPPAHAKPSRATPSPMAKHLTPPPAHSGSRPSSRGSVSRPIQPGSRPASRELPGAIPGSAGGPLLAAALSGLITRDPNHGSPVVQPGFPPNRIAHPVHQPLIVSDAQAIGANLLTVPQGHHNLPVHGQPLYIKPEKPSPRPSPRTSPVPSVHSRTPSPRPPPQEDGLSITRHAMPVTAAQKKQMFANRSHQHAPHPHRPPPLQLPREICHRGSTPEPEQQKQKDAMVSMAIPSGVTMAGPINANHQGLHHKLDVSSHALANLLQMRGPLVADAPGIAPGVSSAISIPLVVPRASLLSVPRQQFSRVQVQTKSAMHPFPASTVQVTPRSTATVTASFTQPIMSMPRLVVAPPSGDDVKKSQADKENCMPILTPQDIKTENLEINIKPEAAPEPTMVKREQQYNMRVVNLANFPTGQSTYRASYRSQSLAIHRAKIGCITTAGKSLDILRQNIQKNMNKEIDEVIQKYIEKYFRPGIGNIKKNNGEDSVNEEHILAVCRQILEEAKKMYISDARSLTPVADLSDNASETGSLIESSRPIRTQRIFSRKRKGSSDSEASQPVKRKTGGKRGRPPNVHVSGRSTPSKPGKANEPVKREGPKWDPERLKADTTFVMGARANKALGLGATRGRLYMKHPDVFKYAGDQDDKQWLHEHHHMPATGGKAYMLLVEDVRALVATDEYRNSPGLLLNEIIGFCVPEWMIKKMKAQMQAMRTDAPKTKHRGRGHIPTTQTGRDTPVHHYNDVTTSSSSITGKLTPDDHKSDTQPSPTNTEDLDLLTDHDEPGPSPFNMTGGFDTSAIVEPTAALSDVDGLDDGPIPEPFHSFQ